MIMSDKKKMSIILLAIFSLLLGGMGILWLFLKDSSPMATPGSNQAHTIATTSAPLETELVILHDQVHSAINEHGAGLIENNFLSVDAMVALKQQVQQADAYYNQGKGSKARPIYSKILSRVEHLVAQQGSQREAEQLAGQLIEKIKAAAPIKNAAPTPYQLAVNASDQGRTLIRNKDYTQAVETFQEGLNKIQELQQAATDVAQQLVNAIADAIERYNIPEAKAQLAQLQTVNANHPQIDSLRVSIQTVESLQPKFVAIDKLLSAQQFEQAIAKYDQLIAQYPTLDLIQAKRQAAQQSYIEHTVSPLITTAEGLYQQGKLDASLLKFKQAQRILPEDKSIAEAIQLIENEIRSRIIDEKLASAYAAYQASQWQRARTLYEEVLALDPSNTEAREGKDKSTQWLIKKIEYQQLIATAEKDYSAGRMPSAIVRLNEALAIKPDNIPLTGKQVAMRQDLQNQNKKVSVIIKSDNKSYVSIIGVLPPERIRNKELNLFPNVYKVKAQRSGYHEVEREVKINATNPSNMINIRCTEKL